jgi:hypothetical protein
MLRTVLPKYPVKNERTYLMNDVFNIINTICVTFATVAGSWIAYKGYKKQKRHNLTDIEITIIDDEKRDEYFWYVKYRFNNCQKTIEKIVFKVQTPFSLFKYWESKTIKKCVIKDNTLELYNIFDNDYVLFCLKIEKNKSDIYRKKVEKLLTIDPIMMIDSEFIRLEKRSLNYSPLHYAQQ